MKQNTLIDSRGAAANNQEIESPVLEVDKSSSGPENYEILRTNRRTDILVGPIKSVTFDVETNALSPEYQDD